MKVVVHVDGGSRGNPGPAAAAAVVTNPEGAVLDEAMLPLGETTNNVAEYRALLLGLERARALGASEVEVINDSELIAHQVNGRYRVKNADLRPLHAEALKRLGAFDAWSVRPVPRAQNAEADALVNRCLDALEGDGGGALHEREAEPPAAPRAAPGAALRELRALLGPAAVLEPTADYEHDATEGRGVQGRADAVALPDSAADAARVVAWCYAHDVPIVPRGGGTGFAGGAVPRDGGVVLGLERLRAVRAFEPLLWRMSVEAGLPTAHVHRLARENGLYYPPDPGAAEQSQIGGNVATNAGGPHAFGHGPTGQWVTGLEFVAAPGELVRIGGATRKDVAGYDLRNLLVGSEGTLGVITAVWLRLIPAPEAALPVVAAYPDAVAGCAAVERVYGSGLQPATLEYLDEGTLAAAREAFPWPLEASGRFMVIAEAEGSAPEARRLAGELGEALGEGAVAVHAPEAPRDVAALWRWRGGVSLAVTAQRGGKVSEDVAVPVDRLLEAIEATVEVGRRHDLEACSWGHAGDGNLHATFLVARDDAAGLDRAAAAAEELHELAVRMGGTITGEHGLGLLRSGALARQWPPRALELHEAVKRAFDPKGLFNPGKKLARG